MVNTCMHAFKQHFVRVYMYLCVYVCVCVCVRVHVNSKHGAWMHESLFSLLIKKKKYTKHNSIWSVLTQACSRAPCRPLVCILRVHSMASSRSPPYWQSRWSNRVGGFFFGRLVFILVHCSFALNSILFRPTPCLAMMTYSGAFVNICCWDLDKHFDIALDRLLGAINGQLVDAVLVDLDVVEQRGTMLVTE